ncbi:hypothetical protein AABB24_008346 [Solanum stoloniferum]|uniref:Integrase catalytic domain-containing protein n=1 Tax=Solanum stoloniferum TaxID=62892 RepID=A0ABD2USF5_9SOLN
MYAKTQFGRCVKVIRSDNETKFVNTICKDVFKRFGIVHQTSCAYTPQQNGVAERKHRHLLEVTRALRFQADIPINLWGLCVLAAVHIINRLPSSVLQNRSPYERFYNKKPCLSHLKVIECLCYAKVIQEHDKLKPRSKMTVHMGYSMTQKGYILYDLETRQLGVSRYVIFREDIFPFKNNNSGSDNKLFVPWVSEYGMKDMAEVSVTHEETTPEVHNTQSEENRQVEVSVTPDRGTRRSTRDRNPPIWLKDFVLLSVNDTVDYPMSRYVACAHLAPRYQAFIVSISTSTEPKTYYEAITDPRWVEAMKEEVSALQQNNTWEVVSLPEGKKPIGCRWIYKIKYKVDGEVERFKARLVAKGYSQKEGIDYQETFSQ